MEQYLVVQALKDFLRFRRLLPWVLLFAFTFGLGVLWHTLSPYASKAEQYSQISSILVFRMLALASAIYTTAIIGQEVEQRTIVYLLTRPIPRWKLLITRFIASVTVVAGIGVVSAWLLSVAVFQGSGFSNPLLVKDIEALCVGALSYGALFLFVSLTLNRSMLVCLLFVFGWETFVPNLPGELYRLSIFSYLQAIAEHPQVSLGKSLMAFVSGSLGTNVVSAGTALTTMAVLIIVGVSASAWWFTNFEYVPREDAE